MIFRGQANGNWALESSAERRVKSKQGTDPITPSVLVDYLERELIDPARAEGHGRKDGEKLDDLELLAELQHNQAATCLLDFTHNFHIALWFACASSSESNENRKSGKVFVMNYSDINTFRQVGKNVTSIRDILMPTSGQVRGQKTQGYKQPDICYWPPSVQNNRVVSQSSCFIFSANSIPKSAYEEVTIEEGDKKDVLQGLKLFYGLEKRTIFRDLVGFAIANNQDEELRELPTPPALSTSPTPPIPSSALRYFEEGNRLFQKQKL